MNLKLDTQESQSLMIELLIESVTQARTTNSLLLSQLTKENNFTHKEAADYYDDIYNRHRISLFNQIETLFGKGFNPDDLLKKIL